MVEEIQVLQQVKAAEIEEVRRQHEATSRDQREKLASLQLNLLQTWKCLMEVVRDYRRLKEICLKFPEWGRITVQGLGSQVMLCSNSLRQCKVSI